MSHCSVLQRWMEIKTELFLWGRLGWGEEFVQRVISAMSLSRVHSLCGGKEVERSLQTLYSASSCFPQCCPKTWVCSQKREMLLLPKAISHSSPSGKLLGLAGGGDSRKFYLLSLLASHCLHLLIACIPAQRPFAISTGIYQYNNSRFVAFRLKHGREGGKTCSEALCLYYL